jgi:hypothetical protein
LKEKRQKNIQLKEDKIKNKNKKEEGDLLYYSYE